MVPLYWALDVGLQLAIIDSCAKYAEKRYSFLSTGSTFGWGWTHSTTQKFSLRYITNTSDILGHRLLPESTKATKTEKWKRIRLNTDGVVEKKKNHVWVTLKLASNTLLSQLFSGQHSTSVQPRGIQNTDMRTLNSLLGSHVHLDWVTPGNQYIIICRSVCLEKSLSKVVFFVHLETEMNYKEHMVHRNTCYF